MIDAKTKKYIISDTGPILTFIFIDGLKFLKHYCGNQDICIPQKVYEETKNQIEKIQNEKFLSDFRKFGFKVINVSAEDINNLEQDIKTKEIMYLDIHDGEKEVLAYANKYKGDSLVIIDDKAAREVSNHFELEIIGAIGILEYEIKQRQINVKEVTELVKIIKDSNRYYSNKLLDLLINSAKKIEELDKIYESPKSNITMENKKQDSLTKAPENDDSYKP